MKITLKTIILFVFLTSIANALVDQKLLDRLDYGIYLGRNEGGRTCYVEVSSKVMVPRTRPTFTLEIFNRKGDLQWYSLSNSMLGGRGDCPVILEENLDILKVKNAGSEAPCFSMQHLSNRKGVVIEFLSREQTKVKTLDENGVLSASCQIKN